MLLAKTLRLLPHNIFVLVLIVLIVRDAHLKCSNTGDCRRYDCNDTLAIAPPECFDNVDEMNCFRTCKDPEELLKCYKDYNGTEEYCVLRYARSLITIHPDSIPPSNNQPPINYGEYRTYHPGLPCKIKCQIDPAFWACVHRCDGHGCFTSFRRCEFGNGTHGPPCDRNAPLMSNASSSSYMDNEDCINCFVENLKNEVDTHEDCIFRYSTTASTIPISGDDESKRQAELDALPQCVYTQGKSLRGTNGINDTAAYEDVIACLNDISQAPHNATSEDMEKCYTVRLMRRQIDLCFKPSYTPQCAGPDADASINCQDRCLAALTKPFCYIPCPRNPIVEDCKQDCETKWPTIPCNSCNLSGEPFPDFMLDSGRVRLMDYQTRIGTCGSSPVNYTCAIGEIHEDTRPQITNYPEWERDVVRLRNCRSKRHIVEFAKRLLIAKNSKGSFDNSIGLLANHFTFRECYLTDCKSRSETDAQYCMYNCMSKERPAEEMDFVCNDNATTIGHPVGEFLSGYANYMRSEIVIWCLLQENQDADLSFEALLETVTDFDRYEELYYCEKGFREQDDNGTVLIDVPIADFEQIAQILYDIERDWCSLCLGLTKNTFHPYDLDHAKCEYNHCYVDKLAEACKPLRSLETVIKAVLPGECNWKMDFALSPEPFRIWGTYFDEIPPRDETHNLMRPNALKYLMKSSIRLSRGHYIFPYFLVIRPVCEEGFYDDNVYKFISSGGLPIVKIRYYPTTSRQMYVDLMQAEFQGALVNLERTTTADKLYLPKNPLNRVNKSAEEKNKYDGKTGCHLNLCYPAFLVSVNVDYTEFNSVYLNYVPQPLIQIPIFEVYITNQHTISSEHTHGFAATLHLRDESGQGTLKVADRRDPPAAGEFFPTRKVQVYEDTQFVHLWARLPDSGYTGIDAPSGPELEHISDHNCVEYPTNTDKTAIGGNPFFPLDSEDFFQFHYTHGNAPVVVVAGFYDPNLVIIGDPDMRKFELLRWRFEVTAGSIEKPSPHLFHAGYPCFSDHFRVKGFVKPMYSLFDRIDPEYWLEFYRMRFAPKNYQRVNVTRAIFKAVTLEDRILFVTTSGIVSFYQNTNITAGLGKAWEVEPDDRLKRCFKIVRVAKRAHPKGDTIVAVTYDYQVIDQKQITTDISQQIWVGSYQGKGIPIQWQELTSGLTIENLKEERVFAQDSDKVGHTEDLPPKKILGVPVERRETNPKSQIEAICYKTYRSNMGKASYIELIEDQGWCDAIDATPVIAVDQKIQVLVRMRAYYSGGTSLTGGASHQRVVIFYVVASFNTDITAAQSSIWQINSIIPRIPCQDEHEESIPSVVQFSKNYFRQGEPDQVKGDYGCHTEPENKKEENKIYLHGMTYTRSYNHHLFLYGNKLLQSTDGGETFVQLTSFPVKGDDYKCKKSGLSYHKINVMTFDDLGHYAFLTSKRELWYGNLGSLVQIRLRPSRAHSMTLARLPEVHHLSEAVPFTVFFDSSNALIELVAVVNENGTVTRIARRGLNERTILRARHLIDQIAEVSNDRFQKLFAHANTVIQGTSGSQAVNPYIDERLLEEIKYDPLKWSVFCPFASPVFSHNFSQRYGRTQNFFFPAPRQHIQLGDVNIKTSLYTYQAITFNLIWNSFFHYPYRSYSFVDTDPFTVWSKNKEAEQVLGRLTFLSNDPNEHGIFVKPDKYRRFKVGLEDDSRVYATYYMDYGYVVEMKIEYSISNDYTLNPIDYLTQHLDAILLNVDNANGSLIQINTEKEVLASKAAVRYVINMSIRKNTGLPQSFPGRDGIQVPIKLHLIGGFGSCIPTESSGIVGDSIATVIQVGCPPSIDLVFDWASTLRSIQFREISAHHGLKKGECYNGEEFCFFARYPLIPHFHTFDISKQEYYNFSGKYIMRIIAGGYSRDSMITYSVEEQHAFNIPGVSDVSLIWNEWDTEFHQKVQRPNSYLTTSGRNDSREIILQAGISAIQWGCHTLSPCARISPRAGLESVYYFKIFVTNRGVDNDTLCLFEKEFVILLYGFPPSPEIQLVTTVVFYIFVITTLYIAYFCLRSHKKVWRSTALKLYGWFQVIKDTLPKSWFKTAEEDDEEELREEQRRKDEIILSLQGHLNVPKLIPKDAKAPIKRNEDEIGLSRSMMSLLTSKPSASSFLSGSSDDSRKYIIDPLAQRPEATTWTDLIYERIISKRLAAIIEKNRQKAEELKKKKEEEGYFRY